MNVLPKTGVAWGRLFLLPFKVYVLAAWFVVQFYLREAGRRWDPADITPFLLGYLLCVVVLLLGGAAQLICRRKKDATLTLIAAALGIFCIWMLPGLAKA